MTKSSITKLGKIRLTLWALAAVALIAFAVIKIQENNRLGEAMTPTEAARESIKAVFSLVDHNGKSVTNESFRGKYLLVFFGFTNCPDVCPTTLNEVTAVMEELGQKAEMIQPLFITVDPERDTQSVMAAYVSLFDPRIIGLTGTLEQIKAATNSFKIYFAKVPIEGDSDDYTMDHSAYLYLFNEDGVFERFFSFGDDVDKIVSGVNEYL